MRCSGILDPTKYAKQSPMNAPTAAATTNTTMNMGAAPCARAKTVPAVTIESLGTIGKTASIQQNANTTSTSHGESPRDTTAASRLAKNSVMVFNHSIGTQYGERNVCLESTVTASRCPG